MLCFTVIIISKCKVYIVYSIVYFRLYFNNHNNNKNMVFKSSYNIIYSML